MTHATVIDMKSQVNAPVVRASAAPPIRVDVSVASLRVPRAASAPAVVERSFVANVLPPASVDPTESVP